jgi:hypothetical protein
MQERFRPQPENQKQNAPHAGKGSRGLPECSSEQPSQQRHTEGKTIFSAVEQKYSDTFRDTENLFRIEATNGQGDKNYSEKRKGYSRLYYQKNKEKLKEQKKHYYQKNKEKLKEQSRHRYQKNKEKAREREKRYREKNKKKLKEQKKHYYQENRERIRASKKRYDQENKEKIKEYHRRRYQERKAQREAELARTRPRTA